MKRILLFCFLILLLHLSVKAQTLFRYYLDSNLHFTEQPKAFFSGQGQSVSEGFVLRLYYQSNKNLALIQNFTDSTLEVRNGFFLSYYPDKLKQSAGNYVMGKKDGLWESWNPSGLLADSSLYDQDSLIFRKKYAYDPSTGKLLEEIVVDSMGTTKTTYFKEDGTRLNTTVDEKEDRVFIQTEVEASFPGGPAAWSSYISHELMQHIDEFTNKDNGTCTIRFIVDVDGSVSDIQLLKKTMKGTKLEKIVIEAIQRGPKWIPAMQGGVKVRAYRIQPVTFNTRE